MCLETHSTGREGLDTRTIAGAELGQCVGWEGGCWKPVLRRWADLGQRLIPFLHRTHFFCRFNPTVKEKNPKTKRSLQLASPCLCADLKSRRVPIPVVGVGELGCFWQLVEAVDARAGLAHGLAVKAPTVKVGELLPVVLFILVEVVVVGAHNILQGFRVGLLRLRSPAEKADFKKLWNRSRCFFFW